MSCAPHHHAIALRLLTLAGLHDTDADTILRVEHANRYRKGALPTTVSVSVHLHAAARHALDSIGQSDRVAPAWGRSLIVILGEATERGNR